MAETCTLRVSASKHKEFKFLALRLGKSLQELTEEAVEDCIKKYGGEKA